MTTAQDFIEIEIDSLTNLASLLNRISVSGNIDKETFRKSISLSVKFLGGIPIALCDILGITKPTISRWGNGKNCPHQGVRPMVLRHLSLLLLKKSMNEQKTLLQCH